MEHARWRPQWFLSVQKPDGGTGEYVLRGFRNAGIVESEGPSRQRLRREADVLSALQDTAVKVPRYYGYVEDGDWFLMERVQGEELLTELEDKDQQGQIFREYLSNIAVLHQLDPETLELPKTLIRPVDSESVATWAYRAGEQNYRRNRGGPDPLYEFALWWLHRHRPIPVERLSLCTGDIGANQFFFEGGHFKSMFDLEMAYVGDPLQDIGMMRYRNLCYPTRDFTEGVRHYLQKSGRTADTASLDYWTVVGLLGASLNFAALREHPDPHRPGDMSLILAMNTRRRALAELFHHIYELPLPDRPLRPAATANVFTKYHRLVVDEIGEHYLPEATENTFALRTLHSHSQMLLGCNEIGPAIAAANMDELAAVLPRRPADEAAGLAALEASVQVDPEKNLAPRLAAYYRMEARNEYIFEPVTRACGQAVGVPLERIRA
jgi:aminoglycoside phosphotransferase (APT) family kinase protein